MQQPQEVAQHSVAMQLQQCGGVGGGGGGGRREHIEENTYDNIGVLIPLPLFPPHYSPSLYLLSVQWHAIALSTMACHCVTLFDTRFSIIIIRTCMYMHMAK